METSMVILRRFVLGIGGLSIASAMAAAGPAVANTGPAEFILEVGNQALEIIGANMAPAQKLGYFYQLLHQDFDMPGISRFVLGPYWRVVSKPERKEFRRLLENYLVAVYGQQLAQYGGAELRVSGSRSEPRAAIVTSQIIRPQGGPVEVDWRLSVRDGHYKISDIAIGGISMALTQRSEFGQEIQRGGGQFAALLATMRETIAEGGAVSPGVGSSTPGR
jgi:phospholipid transport system substrate-binding protein